MRPEAPSFVDIETFEKKAVTQKGANFLDFSWINESIWIRGFRETPDRRTDPQTDGLISQWMDGPTDKACYRIAFATKKNIYLGEA